MIFASSNSTYNRRFGGENTAQFKLWAGMQNDISTDLFRFFADLLVITKTWMDAGAPLNINSFQLVHQMLCENLAQGFTLHKRNDSAYIIISVDIESTESLQAKLSVIFQVGDCMVIHINLLRWIKSFFGYDPRPPIGLLPWLDDVFD